MRRSRRVMLLGVTTLFAAWGTARVVDSWRYQASLKQAKARLDSGSPYEARRLLAESAARWPGDGEVEFLLGACEQALGRPDAAAGAWSRVPTDSPFAGHAAMLRVRLLMKRNRFAAAEELLPIALRASGQHAIEARETLVVLFKLEGRFAEVKSLVQEGWDSYPDRFGLLRQLANLDSINPVPIEKIWPALEKAAEISPDDDRIWLGRANLAIRTGEFAKAKGWLDDSLRRAIRPGRGRLLGIFRPTTSRLRRFSPYAPGSPRDPATKSGSGRPWRSCLRVRRVRPKPWSGWPNSNWQSVGPRAPPGCARGRPSWIGPRSIMRYS
jgi:tetratricopeptide (TPR) repeat protein